MHELKQSYVLDGSEMIVYRYVEIWGIGKKTTDIYASSPPINTKK